jgi:hypothetical protein
LARPFTEDKVAQLDRRLRVADELAKRPQVPVIELREEAGHGAAQR